MAVWPGNYVQRRPIDRSLCNRLSLIEIRCRRTLNNILQKRCGHKILCEHIACALHHMTPQALRPEVCSQVPILIERWHWLLLPFLQGKCPEVLPKLRMAATLVTLTLWSFQTWENVGSRKGSSRVWLLLASQDPTQVPTLSGATLLTQVLIHIRAHTSPHFGSKDTSSQLWGSSGLWADFSLKRGAAEIFAPGPCLGH